MKLSSPKDVNAPVDTHAVIYNPDIFGIVKTPGLLLPTSVSMWWQTASLCSIGNCYVHSATMEVLKAMHAET